MSWGEEACIVAVMMLCTGGVWGLWSNRVIDIDAVHASVIQSAPAFWWRETKGPPAEEYASRPPFGAAPGQGLKILDMLASVESSCDSFMIKLMLLTGTGSTWTERDPVDRRARQSVSRTEKG